MGDSIGQTKDGNVRVSCFAAALEGRDPSQKTGNDSSQHG